MNNSLTYLLARLTPKPLRSPVYKYLYDRLKDEYIVSNRTFLGKRILIIGPAESALDDLHNIDDGKYDLIVKMNNGLFIPLPLKGSDNLRCDILFHSLSKDTFTVTREVLRKCGVQLVIHRTPKKSAFLSTIVAARRFRRSTEVKMLPYDHYEDFAERLGGYSPTTGAVCVNFFLNSPVTEVAVVGFTFFTTNYVSGYTDKSDQNKEHWTRVQAVGHHDPAKEALIFNKSIAEAEARGITVNLGPSVKRSLASLTARR